MMMGTDLSAPGDENILALHGEQVREIHGWRERCDRQREKDCVAATLGARRAAARRGSTVYRGGWLTRGAGRLLRPPHNKSRGTVCCWFEPKF
jgi:hypothetical protein